MMSNSTDIAQQKKELRRAIRERKREADRSVMMKESTQIFEEIEKLEAFKTAKVVLAYWSMNDEVFTHDFVMKWYKHKQIYLPLVVGNSLELREFSGMDCMRVGPSFGILEPQEGAIYDNRPIDFAIIPGVAFDIKGNRMGRGKAYYDKLLRTNSMLKIGVAYSFQMVKSVPTDEFDIPMDLVISAK
ncbi:5-formyltetrahydrofolate cyclo-ligase [Perlabentimonas gracilis]|uniref:5-formyltetrahydrofolate cyclo-ligase n=1 Tax=Perlabentimonas gracilis TaxID=2715279 RepID=UPI001407E076|nr:5-formyltetrahydrofolate cyclo-ligase [Perlabentimonas gracilis]NHB70181.1 5-formyltetrahydrofolate cyclo-ligase [Perlabentimonas gracilis]